MQDINYLLKQLDEDKKYLSRPWPDIFSFTVLPVLLYFTLNKSGLINFLSDYYRSYYEKMLKEFFNIRFAEKIQFRNEAVMTVKQFEKRLIEIMKQLFANDLKMRLSFRIPFNKIEDYQKVIFLFCN